MRHLRSIFLIALLLIAGALAYATFAKAKHPNIIFILCDTLRADHLGAYGYKRATSPNLDAFAAESVLFKNAISAAPWTPPSMASMFTGFIPSVHGLNPPNNRADAKRLSMRLSDDFVTLAEHLKLVGYATYGVSASPWSDAAFGLHQGFDKVEHIMRTNAEEINQRAFPMLDKLASKTEPFFLYLHYMDVHKRGDNPTAPYQDFPPSALPRWDYSPQILDQIAKYDAELKFFDEHFGKLVEYLRAKGLYDESIIVFVADHGEQFKERGKIGHGFSLHTEELHVPLIIKVPGQKGQMDALVSSRDIFATVLKLVSPEIKLTSDHISLFESEKLLQRDGIISEGTRLETLKSMSFPDQKRIVLSFKGVSPQQNIDSLESGDLLESFDSKADPKELSKITDQEWIKAQRKIFEESFSKALKSRIASQHTEVSEESLDALQSLGYLGGN